MRPPFTAEQFVDVFARYHEWLWPAPLVLIAVGVGLASLAFVAPRHSRLVAGGLSSLWVWMAVMYHIAFFSFVTPMAYLFGALFLAEAALLGWHGLYTRRLHLAVPADWPARIAGPALALYALVGYPLLGYALGQRYPAFPTFGLPCPTTIFTFALLAWCVRPVPWSVLLIPLGWALVGTSAALNFGLMEDFGLPLAAVLVLALSLRPHAKRTYPAPRERPYQLGF
jgi:hypothetical protein